MKLYVFQQCPETYVVYGDVNGYFPASRNVDNGDEFTVLSPEIDLKHSVCLHILLNDKELFGWIQVHKNSSTNFVKVITKKI